MVTSLRAAIRSPGRIFGQLGFGIGSVHLFLVALGQVPGWCRVWCGDRVRRSDEPVIAAQTDAIALFEGPQRIRDGLQDHWVTELVGLLEGEVDWSTADEEVRCIGSISAEQH